MSAAERWRHALEAWAIPESILAQAEDSPWIHPPVLFDVPEVIAPSPSHDRAREALSQEASVLDVGCGGGVAALALVPEVKTVIGVDHQPEMLAMFRRNAAARSLAVQTIEGYWPDVADQAPVCDVVTAHHVVYNVGDIAPFIRALDAHARNRVVLELPTRHPLANMDEAWRFFWGLERPSAPTPDDLMEVLGEVGIAASQQQWKGPIRAACDLDQAAHFLRIRLCLPASREGEVRDFVAARPEPTERPLATIWWDARPGFS
jgi:SAM-dependent methyltransferase